MQCFFSVTAQQRYKTIDFLVLIINIQSPASDPRVSGAGGVHPAGAEPGEAGARLRGRPWPHPADGGARHPSVPLPSPHTCPVTRGGLSHPCLPDSGHSGLTNRQETRTVFRQPPHPHIRQEEFSGEQWSKWNVDPNVCHDSEGDSSTYDVCSLN